MADDDPDMRGALADALRGEGHDVVEAGDGATLLAIVQRGGIQLVITDLWMPGLGGNDVLRVRRTAGDLVPFVVITAAPARFTDELVSLPAVTILRKPFALDELIRAIGDLMAIAVPVPSVAIGTAPAMPAMPPMSPMIEPDAPAMVPALAPPSGAQPPASDPIGDPPRPASEPPESV